MVSPVSGLFEVLLSAAPNVAAEDEMPPGSVPFEVEIVAERAGPITGASGLSVVAHLPVAEVGRTDVVIVPSMALRDDGEWVPGRYPRLVNWLRSMHASGATICSACTGGLLTAETGLLDGCDATIHWVAENEMRRRHPAVTLRPDQALVVSGDGGRLVSSGAANAWHDLALYLIARHIGPATAQAVARYQLLEWHREGQAAFHVFQPPLDHGDGTILAAQRWVGENHAVANPVEEMAAQSGLPPRTFKRRFKAVTGMTPISYVQTVRVERAKQLLETTAEPVEEVSWAVGYEDPSSFRRLFKRIAGMSPGEYRVRFRVPEVARRSP